MALVQRTRCRRTSGSTQAAIVFLVAAIFNLPRWFEFIYVYDFELRNQTLENGTMTRTNVSVFSGVDLANFRKNEAYIREALSNMKQEAVWRRQTIFFLLHPSFGLLRVAITNVSYVKNQNREKCMKGGQKKHI